MLGSDASGDVCPMWRALRTRSGERASGRVLKGGHGRHDTGRCATRSTLLPRRLRLVAGLADAMDGDEPTMPGPRRVVLTAVPSTRRRCVVRAGSGAYSIKWQIGESM